MSIPIKLPVHVNIDGDLIDAEGRVVANFCWLNDLVHVRKQKEKAEFVADLLNRQPEDLEVYPEPPKALAPGNGHADKGANNFVATIVTETVGVIKRKGNPLFRKGFPNPYGKKKEGENEKPAA